MLGVPVPDTVDDTLGERLDDGVPVPEGLEDDDGEREADPEELLVAEGVPELVPLCAWEEERVPERLRVPVWVPLRVAVPLRDRVPVIVLLRVAVCVAVLVAVGD